MFTNILVPLDGSLLAETALPFAKAVAARTGARLTLVRAAHYASLLGDAAVDQYGAVTAAEEYLAQAVERLTNEGIQVEAGVPFGGATAEWIVEEIEFRHADLVVMATHDRIGMDRLLHGSIAESIVHRSEVPVMLVRGVDAEQLARRFTAMQSSLIVPLDGSEFGEAALAVARELADAVSGRLVLVSVTPKAGQLIAGQGGAITTYTTDDLAELEASIRSYLESTAASMAEATPVEVVVRSGDTATEIAAAAQTYEAAAVVMSTHGRSGTLRTILGSVAGGVLHRISMPVIMVRPRAAQRMQEPIARQVASEA